MRDLALRHRQATRAMVARLDAGTETLRELAAEIRAQRSALFRVLDRLDGGDAQGA
jgi:hypothetical protein